MESQLIRVGTFIGLLFIGCWAFKQYGQPEPAPADQPTPVQPAPVAKIPLYLFTQTNCPPCRQLHKALQDPSVKQELQRFDLKELQPGAPEFEKYKVSLTPTLVAVTGSGPQVKVGYLPPKQLVEWLKGIK